MCHLLFSLTFCALLLFPLSFLATLLPSVWEAVGPWAFNKWSIAYEGQFRFFSFLVCCHVLFRATIDKLNRELDQEKVFQYKVNSSFSAGSYPSVCARECTPVLEHLNPNIGIPAYDILALTRIQKAPSTPRPVNPRLLLTKVQLLHTLSRISPLAIISQPMIVFYICPPTPFLVNRNTDLLPKLKLSPPIDHTAATLPATAAFAPHQVRPSPSLSSPWLTPPAQRLAAVAFRCQSFSWT